MRVPFYDIKAQYNELHEELDQAVHKVLASGTYTISGGTEYLQFEAEMAALHKVKHAISVHSGTDALRIMIDAAGIKDGHEVITTAFTFVASAETIVQAGAIPVFVDIDPVTYNIDPQKIADAINPNTRAIMPVHLFGQLSNVQQIMEIACMHELAVIEDAAQAVGCSHNGTPAGNFSVAAGFSFYVTKNLGAIGDAGMIVTNYDDIAARCRSMRVHGMGGERYYYDYLGYTSRMDEIQAAALRVKLARLAEWNERRSRIAAIYAEMLTDSGLSLPVTAPGNNNTWHQFTVRSTRRDELQAFLKSKEVDSMIYYPVPLHFHAPYAKYSGGPGSLPETERACREVLSLPIHPHMSEDQARFVAESALAFFKS